MIDIKIVILIIALLIFFAYVRKCTQKNKIEYGNIQCLGQRSYQNDYFSVFQSDQKMIATVADGMITHKKGRYAAILAAEVLKENLSTSTEPYFLTIEKSVHEMQAKISTVVVYRSCISTTEPSLALTIASCTPCALRFFQSCVSTFQLMIGRPSSFATALTSAFTPPPTGRSTVGGWPAFS